MVYQLPYVHTCTFMVPNSDEVCIVIQSQILWSESFVKSILTAQNIANKTALQLAVEKGHIQ